MAKEQKVLENPFLEVPVFKNMLHDFQSASSIFLGMRTAFNTRSLTISSIGVSNRVMNYWHENGLMPKGVKDTGGWRKFTALENIWFEIVIRLRSFGLSLKKIKRVRDHIMLWDETSKSYPIFEYYYINSINPDFDSYVAVFSDGVAHIGRLFQIEALKGSQGLGDMILIRLDSFLWAQYAAIGNEQLGLDERKTKIKFSIPISPNELNLINSTRQKGNKEIRARLKGGRMAEIETTQIYPENPAIGDIIKDIKDHSDFAEIKTRFVEGRAQSVEVKKQKRLK